MNATALPDLALEAPAYVALQRQVRGALLAQHPEWVLPNGNSPTCDSYIARFTKLLIQSLPKESGELEQGNTHQSQHEFQFA
jgi:hypothetical protein